jgi:hypothetical protein
MMTAPAWLSLVRRTATVVPVSGWHRSGSDFRLAGSLVNLSSDLLVAMRCNVPLL